MGELSQTSEQQHKDGGKTCCYHHRHYHNYHTIVYSLVGSYFVYESNAYHLEVMQRMGGSDNRRFQGE